MDGRYALAAPVASDGKRKGDQVEDAVLLAVKTFLAGVFPLDSLYGSRDADQRQHHGSGSVPSVQKRAEGQKIFQLAFPFHDDVQRRYDSHLSGCQRPSYDQQYLGCHHPELP